MANNCQIQTPTEYVIQMLKYVRYKDNVFGKSVLENSCGEGNILTEIVKAYIKDAQKSKISKDEIAKGLERDIVAYEIDKNKRAVCINNLNRIVKEMGIEQINWNIKAQDFLKQPIEKYDYIIGNPPYITYHDLSDENREYLKQHFSSCKEGRFDYSYAFIEASICSLKPDGKLIYLVPYSVIKNKFADQLRKYMSPYMVGIYDYSGIKIFPDALTSSVMLYMKNSRNGKNIEYHRVCNQCERKIARTDLKGKWNFGHGDRIEGERFGDHFEVCNSVATLFNRAFVIEEYSLAGDYYYVNGMPIEKQIVYSAVSAKSYNKIKKETQNEPIIIFPYKVEDGKVMHYSPNEFEKNFPKTTSYLKTYIEELKNRKSDPKAAWFEYGRNQAISKVFGQKLVLPMVFTNDVSVCDASNDMIPYAGYFVKCAENSDMTLTQAKKILKSKRFYDYVKAYGTPTTPNSYRVSVNDIKEYRFEWEDNNGKGVV